MSTFRINDATRLALAQAIRKAGASRADVGKAVGVSKSLMSKILNGHIKSMPAEKYDALCNFLGIAPMAYVPGEALSALALSIGARIDKDANFSKLAAAIEEFISTQDVPATPRYVPTKEMAALGRKVIAIVDEDREKPGKVARRIIELLA